VDPQPQIIALRLALATAPGPLLQPCLDFVMATVAERHPSVLERLGDFAGQTLLVEPTDVPRALALELRAPPEHPRLRLANDEDRAAAAARIRGPLGALIALMEGRVDGDALFFSRDITFDGAMETVVALRNALDGEEIDVLDDLFDRLGPLAGPARFVHERADGLLRVAAREVDRFHAFLLGPALQKTEHLARELDELRRELRSRDRRGARPAPLRPALAKPAAATEP
jgi:predicted lipid carrier protein YhbT